MSCLLTRYGKPCIGEVNAFASGLGFLGSDDTRGRDRLFGRLTVGACRCGIDLVSGLSGVDEDGYFIVIHLDKTAGNGDAIGAAFDRVRENSRL